MIGRLLCRLGRHKWMVANRIGLEQLIGEFRCDRCGTFAVAREGEIVDASTVTVLTIDKSPMTFWRNREE